MIISISLLLFTYYFFVDWYSSGECVWHRWRVDPITFLLRCPKRRISAEKMCTRRKEMRDVLMWSRRSFSVFPPLPSRFRTFLHIYFLYFFWWEQFTICYDIEIASVYANIGTERANRRGRRKVSISSSSSSSTSFSPHFIIFIHIRNEHSTHHFHPLHGSPIINLKLLAKAKNMK